MSNTVQAFKHIYSILLPSYSAAVTFMANCFSEFYWILSAAVLLWAVDVGVYRPALASPVAVAAPQLKNGPWTLIHEFPGLAQLPDCIALPGQILQCLRWRTLKAVGKPGMFYRPRTRRSLTSSFIALLLLMSGVEPNPGPSMQFEETNFAVLNLRSVVGKAAELHDVIADLQLDVLAITETWVPSDAPDVIKNDFVPPGYLVAHEHRGSSDDRRGGGIAIVYLTTSQCQTD